MTGGELGTFGLNDVSKISEILQEALRQNTIAIGEVKYCEDRQNDILHEIEFGDHSKRDLSKLAIELRNIRRRRRIAKNTISIVQPMLNWMKNNDISKNRLFSAIGETRRIDKLLNESVYHYKTEDDKVIEHEGGND